jgi:hypothetical protein
MLHSFDLTDGVKPSSALVEGPKGEFYGTTVNRFAPPTGPPHSELLQCVARRKRNVKAVNPRCLTIAEIYPGIEEAAPRVGADVYELYPVVDVIAHEYQGPADSMAASKSASDFIDQMIGMFALRAFAGSKAILEIPLRKVVKVENLLC